MDFKNQEFVNKFLAILAVVIMVALIGLIATNAAFNQKVHSVHGPDDTKSSYMVLGNREDNTSSWVKRDFDLNGKKVDLNAQTFDGTFYNNAPNQIISWKLTIHIKNDCFINNAWCGVMEIHQYVGTDRETVQTLDLRNYNLDEITLDYQHDGDLLIPLKRGDYLVYYPSAKDGELPIGGKEELTMGIIFYYLDSMNLSDYELEYNYHRDITEHFGFYGVILLGVLWIVLYFMQKIAQLSYIRARNELEFKKSGISCMSEIYDVIYIVDLLKDDLISTDSDVYADNKLKGNGAKEKLTNLVMDDVSDTYKELVASFIDLDTLQDRLQKESIACEYISNTRGWCQARFFAMERIEGQPVNMAVFTIHVIHDEKLEMDKIEQQLSEETSDKSPYGVLYNYISPEFDTSIQAMVGRALQLSGKCEDELSKVYAADIDQEGKKLLLMTDKLEDCLKLSAGLMELDSDSYSFRDLVLNLLEYIRKPVSNKGLSFKTDISPKIPSVLQGDQDKIAKIITCLLENAVTCTKTGTITFSIFAKDKENKVHLLISVKDSGPGYTEDEVKDFARDFYEPGQRSRHLMSKFGLELSLVDGFLQLMDSELKLISMYGEGSEFYFEIEQLIEDQTPVGKIEF